MDTQNNEHLGKTIWNDIRRGDILGNLRREYRELKDFYLDSTRRERLENMGWFRRGLYLTWWFIKGLFLKLTPVRRILVLLGLFFLLRVSQSGSNSSDSTIFGILLIIFVLMLELKDKLLARGELRAGRAVQDALMPPASPIIAGWDVWLFTQPANDVGGDLVDYMKVNGSRHGLALGDVAGKGLPAALFMARLQATLRALIPDFTSLSDCANKLNDIFNRDGLPSKFASLVYLEVLENTGKVRYVNAGHLPPYLVGSGGVREMPKGESAIGLLKKETYSEQKVELKEGEWLLIYSDGLTEAMNLEGEFFGEKRLEQLLPIIAGLSAPAAGRRLLEAISAFIDTAAPHDDLSMIILKRKGA